MRALTSSELCDLQAVRRSIQPLKLQSSSIAALVREWEPIIQPSTKEMDEVFAVVDATGQPTGAVGPRWLFHRFGLPHRAAHVGLATPGGLILLQRRSRHKPDNPDVWDMPASGHVSEQIDGRAASVEETALREIGEELFGLPSQYSAERVVALLQGELQPVGPAFKLYEEDEGRNPPHYNREVIQVFAGTLNVTGAASLLPDREELAGVYLCRAEEAWRILDEPDVAPACRVSLRRYLEWAGQQP
jgi:isopentenyldiphosphate isomerase